MERNEHLNWIGERWCAADAGATYELGARIGGPECWPRSRAADVRAALRANATAADGWSALARARRWELLARIADALDFEALARELEPDLGLDAGEARARCEEDVFRFREALELLRDGEPASGVGVFRAHWSDFVGGLAMRVAPHLLAGQAVLVLSDPRLPRAAEALARACERAALPAGVITLLHDDGSECGDCALESAGLAFVRWKERDERLDELVSRHAVRVETSWQLWRATNATTVVESSADPALEALRVVESFCGRSSTLSGQHPGAIARVLCHERLFSRFTEELLGRLETAPDVRHAVPALDADLDDHLRRAWSLGLDEGATPIFGSAPSDRGDSDVSRGACGIVFTNVDPRSGLARLTRPAPVLGLIRVASDSRARELQRELDGSPKKEHRPLRS
ncbi:MAG: aldehyde dehydrogenase family protein [Planctomycetes bacterium]|nr:aldehyde dehydrogenase family protein [Planctomycetota bacterium]